MNSHVMTALPGERTK